MPQGSRRSQLSGLWVVPTHILPYLLRTLCYIEEEWACSWVAGWALSFSVVSWAEGFIQDRVFPS